MECGVNMAIAYIQLSLAMFLVGANVAVGKYIVHEIPVFLFSEMRFMIALVFLVPILLAGEQKKIEFSRSLCGNLFLQSFFGVFLFSILMLYGVQYTSATSAGIITSTIPAAVAVLSYFLLRERATARQISSVFLAVAGIAIITFQGGSAGKVNTLIGNTLIIGAVISEALFIIYAKKLLGILTPIQLAVGVNFIGFLLFLPFAANEAISFEFGKISVAMWATISYYAITASVISFILWYRGVSKVRANIAGLFTGFMPVAAMIVSILFLKETFGYTQLAGIVSVLAAIYLGTTESVEIKAKAQNEELAS